MGVLEGVGNRKMNNSTLLKSLGYAVENFLYDSGVPEKIRWVPTPQSRLYGEIGKSDLGGGYFEDIRTGLGGK